LAGQHVIRIATRTGSGGRGEDRLATFDLTDGLIIVVADGAGGTGSGGRAAEAVCAAVGQAVSDGPRREHEWTRWLSAVDHSIHKAGSGGETTAVIVQVYRGEICGVSVGDSGAATIEGGVLFDLTEYQNRKPLVGSCNARPVGFGPRPFRGRLLVASDGLLKYSGRDKLIVAATGLPLEAAVESLIAGVRLRSGKLPDDIAIALCEETS
jgi:PPM family protein phosphatase